MIFGLRTFLDLGVIFLVFQFLKTVLESAQEFVRGLFSEGKSDFQTPSVTLGFWRQQTDNNRQ